MSLKIEDILNDLEKTASADSTPETDFASGLVEKTASSNETVPTPAPEASEDEIVKQADAQGRIMAQAFVNELQNQAVAPVGEYPADPGAISNNPGLELPRGEANQPHAEANAKVNGIILCRPLIPIDNESIGYLPGEIRDKVDPYMLAY